MPEFNNINYELTDGEKFALICGMLAGLKLQDKTQPPTQLTTTLEPIGIGGLGGIGLMASDISYDGNNKISIPVLTHDVDTEYSGFSLSVSYDSSRIRIDSISEGDFGPLSIKTINTGKAYAGAMLAEGEFKKEPNIVCYLNCTILNPPTKGNPIEIKFNNSSGYDINYCTLLTWVLNETDKKYYSYFITPTVNQGCMIKSEEPERVENNLGEEQEIATPASPSLISLGTSYISPGTRSAMPIFTNANTKDGILYNKFNIQAIVPKDYINILTVIRVKGYEEWVLDYSESYNENGDLVLDIFGSREEAKLDNSSPGYIEFYLSNEVINSFKCTIKNLYSELIGPGGSLGTLCGDGLLYYPLQPPGQGLPDSGPSNDTGPSNNILNNDSISKIVITGKVYSSTAQTIILNVNGNKYPVVLQPGWNDLQVYIPILSPDDIWEETTIKIESEGYILIPGGFQWEVLTSPEAPLGLSSPRLLDRFEIKDVYDILQEIKPIPIDLDGIIDKLELIDEIKSDLLNIVKNEFNGIDEHSLEDFLMVDIEKLPREPRNYDENIIEDAEYVDITLVNKVEANILEPLGNETTETVDFIDIEIEKGETV